MSDALRRAKRRRRYAEVPEALLFNPEISSHAKTAWGILDRHIDNRVESLGTETEGVAFPSRQTLAGYMGVGLDTVDRALAELRLAGWLSTTRRGQGRTALNELHDEPDAAQARLQETARVRRQEAARARSPKKNGPKVNGHEGTFSDENAEEDDSTDPASPSSRGSSDENASSVNTDADLTVGAKTKRFGGATSSDKQYTPKAGRAKASDQQKRDREYRRHANAEAVELADRIFAEVRPALVENAQVLELAVGQMLANGFTAAQIEAAARHPECRAWTYKALAFLATKERTAKTTGPDGFPLKARPGPPPPPLIVPVDRPARTPEEIARTREWADRARAAAGIKR